MIQPPSIWAGLNAPNLNTEGWFLRGGTDAQVLTKEDDQMQDHLHVDSGHTHAIDPHIHAYAENYQRINYDQDNNCLPGATWCEYYSVFASGWELNGMYWSPNTNAAYTNAYASYSGIGAVADGFKRGAETRPKNIRVAYIIKVF